MKVQLLKQQLPILITVQATDLIHWTSFSEHPEGFAFAIEGAPTQKITSEIDVFLRSYAQKKQAPLPSLAWKRLSSFTLQTLHALSLLPFGSLISYKQVAESLGHPKAARAVGGACGRNPFPFFVPCHRVIASSQGLGGFTGNINFKKLLIDFERKS